MNNEAMSQLLAPIGELQSAMAQVEISDAAAEAAIAEVLSGASEADAAAEEERRAKEARAARSEARGKALEALRHAQLAARLDAQLRDATDEQKRAVVRHYERSLADFGAALVGEAIPDQAKPKTVAAMVSYLDRARALRLELQRPTLEHDAADGDARRKVLLAMVASSHFSALARGVQARAAALSQDPGWSRFVLFAEVADCFVAYLKHSPTHNHALTKATTDVLAELEALSAQLRSEEDTVLSAS
mmetsp:Transcript_14946/g.45251  ORF Transcript_14946/g.45251 Transcript_14946/m.45251 type:complete len:247 (+) Transcript_14946:31-771(+)